jgi:hypothetical protein
MWPRELASIVFDWANIALICSLVAGVISTVLIVWTGNAKEAYLRSDVVSATERATNADTRAAEATAKAEAERLARVEIEARIAPRRLDDVQQRAIADSLSKYRGQKYSAMIAQTTDGKTLWVALDKTLRLAGWIRLPPAGLSSGAPPAGVAINPEPGVWIGVNPHHMQDIGLAASALKLALENEGIDAAWYREEGPMMSAPDSLLIVIGAKP